MREALSTFGLVLLLATPAAAQHSNSSGGSTPPGLNHFPRRDIRFGAGTPDSATPGAAN
jgi:hypothetical protein